MKSSTKVSLISAAVAAALGSTANALPPADWTNNQISSSNIYYAAGGSAEVLAIFSALYQNLQAGTIDVYTDGTGTAAHPQSNSYLVVSGTTNANSSLGAGVNIGFMYKYNGGSGPNGVAPQTGTGGTLAYPTTASLAAANTPAPNTPGAGNGNAVQPTYTGTFSNTNSVQPDFGIADTEEVLLNQLWNLPAVSSTNNAPVTPYNLSGGLSSPGWVVTFGVAVTDSVYAQKKNWSKAEVAAVLAGKVNTWTQLTADNGSAMTVSGPVVLLDRGSGSGTKATENAYFLNYPAICSAIGGRVNPHSVSGSCTAVTNVQNYTTGYTSAVNAAQTATSYVDYKEPSNPAITEDLVNVNQAGLGAIAIIGLEFPPVYYQHTTGTNDYEFVALNGVYPDTETSGDNINNAAGGTTHYTNLINGSYDFWAQTSINSLPSWGANATTPASCGTSTVQSITCDVFTTLINANPLLPVEGVAGSHTGSAFPQSAPGILFNQKTSLATDAGNLPSTNGQNTVEPKVFLKSVSPAAADPLFTP
jgi:hypothetical protein